MPDAAVDGVTYFDVRLADAYEQVSLSNILVVVSHVQVIGHVQVNLYAGLEHRIWPSSWNPEAWTSKLKAHFGYRGLLRTLRLPDGGPISMAGL